MLRICIARKNTHVAADSGFCAFPAIGGNRVPAGDESSVSVQRNAENDNAYHCVKTAIRGKYAAQVFVSNVDNRSAQANSLDRNKLVLRIARCWGSGSLGLANGGRLTGALSVNHIGLFSKLSISISRLPFRKKRQTQFLLRTSSYLSGRDQLCCFWLL